MRHRVWVLGAPDPEMELIESILRACGEHVEYATVWRDGVRRRVTPAEAYAADVEIGEGLRGLRATAYMVECAPAVLVGSSVDGIDWAGEAITIDHHRPGDPGYGRPPEEFLPASSLGQVIAVLGQVTTYPAEWQRVAVPRHPHWCGAIELHRGVWVARTAGEEGDPGQDDDETATAAVIPAEYVLAAAADHCLAAAYRGECPGVDPDALMRWRVESRAQWQRRPVEAVLADVERAREALRSAPVVVLSHRHIERTTQHCFDGISCAVDLDGQGICGCACDGCTGQAELVVRWERVARDMRGRHVPELPEASAREGICFVADGLPGRDGRVKIVCQSGTPEQIRAFMTVWAPAQGLVDIYGDPERGFAGGYLQEGTR